MILQTFLVTNQAAPGFFQLWDGGPDGTHGPQTGSPSTEPDELETTLNLSHSNTIHCSLIDADVRI